MWDSDYEPQRRPERLTPEQFLQRFKQDSALQNVKQIRFVISDKNRNDYGHFEVTRRDPLWDEFLWPVI